MTRWLFVLVGICACGSNPDGMQPASDGGGSAGDARVGDGGSAETGCGTLLATIRDFRQQHPDFESYQGDAAFLGIVEPMLGAGGKPVYAHPGPTAETTGPAEFAQWYNDVPGVNLASSVELTLVEQTPGLYVYETSAFFPIDQQGFGDEGNAHNYHFTTEIHTTFEYKGGELFTFNGDDDLWLFINDRLAIDLGGLHPALSQTLDFDARATELGLEIGGTYRMDVFHAERHTPGSNFRIETTIDCFVVP